VWQPYLGQREFVAFFKYLPPGEDRPAPIDYSTDLGMMTYDIFDLSRPGRNTDKPFISLFHARIEHGVLNVPGWEELDKDGKPLVLKPERGQS
jgi:CRISPR-associated protein Cas5d